MGKGSESRIRAEGLSGTGCPAESPLLQACPRTSAEKTGCSSERFSGCDPMCHRSKARRRSPSHPCYSQPPHPPSTVAWLDLRPSLACTVVGLVHTVSPDVFRVSHREPRYRASSLLLALFRRRLPLASLLGVGLLALLREDDGGLAEEILEPVLRVLALALLEPLDGLGHALLGELLLFYKVPTAAGRSALPLFFTNTSSSRELQDGAKSRQSRRGQQSTGEGGSLPSQAKGVRAAGVGPSRENGSAQPTPSGGLVLCALFEPFDVRLAPLEGALAHVDHLGLPEQPAGLLEGKGVGDHLLELLGRVLLVQLGEHSFEAARASPGKAQTGRSSRGGG
eukprot:scaffold8263_cov104-Isochrysis_galbana.AAC.8